jgi:hypothetical protein
MPRLLRGHGGCAIFWHDSLHHWVTPITSPKSDRIVGIRLSASPSDLVVFCVYLPSRLGCTEVFRQVLDELESSFLLYPNSRIVFAGDCNADPGKAGGPYGL